MYVLMMHVLKGNHISISHQFQLCLDVFSRQYSTLITTQPTLEFNTHSTLTLQFYLFFI